MLETQLSFANHAYFRTKEPNNDIDVFLELFMKDMKKLWKEGVKIMDVSLWKGVHSKSHHLFHHHRLP
jgi:hypothetical protein